MSKLPIDPILAYSQRDAELTLRLIEWQRQHPIPVIRYVTGPGHSADETEEVVRE